MIADAEKKMGRFSVQVELANDEDLMRVKDKRLSPEQVRRVTVSGLVDTGATRLVISKAVADKLRLTVSGIIKVRYTDGRTAKRPVAERIRLSIGGRSSIFNGIIEPSKDSILIGAIVLEDLDFVVDCTGQKLVPRDPKQIISEIE